MIINNKKLNIFRNSNNSNKTKILLLKTIPAKIKFKIKLRNKETSGIREKRYLKSISINLLVLKRIV